MGNAQQRLTRQDWINAGFRALVAEGVGGLRAEAIARKLKTTKGSFYWHFKGVTDYQVAMLTYWEVAATDDIIAELVQLPPGIVRLERALERALEVSDVHGGLAAEPAIREWARFYAPARSAVARVDEKRIDALAGILQQIDSPARVSADLLYMAYLGMIQVALIHGVGAVSKDMLTALARGQPIQG